MLRRSRPSTLHFSNVVSIRSFTASNVWCCQRPEGRQSRGHRNRTPRVRKDTASDRVFLWLWLIHIRVLLPGQHVHGVPIYADHLHAQLDLSLHVFADRAQ